ncbi:hypothetical protein [Raineyella fluvialis]|uniref:DUF4157 domain-containing protein n=1 Tax=Raineyella fluvialis TaxID=2662261 RepID=A0A5Q2FAW2_9ACTN|nr:hypothetical protein [Raineyella fluvialis]QGF24002.1 hypothetical protein Rai3103_10285 [Raineyella fluvialis]
MDARLRTTANWINLSTPLGLLIAALGRSRLRRGPRGLLLAEGYRLSFPIAGAFTVGSVVITPGDLEVLGVRLPRLLTHEERHATQWAAWLGLPMLPAYLLAMAWSWLRTGDQASANVFEVRAGLADGGYRAAGSGRPVRRRADRSR